MKLGFTPFNPLLLFRFPKTLLLLVLFMFNIGNTTYGQSGCTPISTLPCDQVQVSLPVSLSFSSSVAGTLPDKNGAGTGFTMVDAYSGTRLTADGTPTNTNVRGYEASKLTLSGGRLQIATNKGIAYLTNNNQINSLGIKVDSRGKLRIETTLVNPYNGSSGQQGGLWFGLNDKTFLKLVVTANKVEMRREINDVSSTVTGTTNPDQRITGAITNLNTMTVRLRLVIDPTANTAEGFYSTDGVTYLNAGAAYSTKTLNISGMGLTTSTSYAGIFATYRNGSTSVIYTFEDFNVQAVSSSTGAPVFSPDSYNFSVTENVALGTWVGSVSASDPNGDALSYSIVAGNANSTFSINAATGAISVAKFLSYHKKNSYALTVRVKDASGLSDDANVAITVNAGPSVPNFSTIGWSSVAPQEFAVNEVQGEAVNGKLYTFGGYYIHPITKNWTPTDRAYVYNPVTNVWARIASMPPMNGTNYGGVTHAGFATDGTDIYFAGGYTSNSTGDGQTFGTNEVWKYIVAENRYVRLPNLPVIIGSGQLEYLNGKLHHIGGHGRTRTTDVGSHYVLDLDNLAAGWKTAAPLPNPTNHAGSTVYEGKIYYMGGQHSYDHNSDTQKDMYVYNPASNTWTRLADFPVPSGATGRAHISSSVFVMGNRIFLLGGDIAHTVNCNLVSAYTPATNTWQNLTPLPISIRGGVAATLGGNLYYTGGANSKATFKGIPGGSTTQQVASFTLINASTDQPIQTLTNGSTLNLATLPSRNLNIRASTSPSTVGSVVFNLSGAQSRTVTESRAPYALFGDNNAGDYYAWTPAVGSYTLKATPFTASGGTGTAGTSLTVSFNVIDQAATTSTMLEDPTVSQVKMYPNPSTKNDVHIEVQNTGQQGKATLWLMDMSGHLLEVQYLPIDHKGNVSTILTSTRQLPPGIYLIQIQLPVGQIQRRLVIN